MQSVLDILKKCESFFAEKGIPNAKNDAQCLLAHVLGCKRLDLFLKHDMPIDELQLEKFRSLVRRRMKREPLQHILGSVDFFGLKLLCDRRALIPRHETEELCEKISEIFSDRKEDNLKILDLGTGSGAIILSLISYFKNAEGIAVDMSDEALSLASENAKLNGLSERVKLLKSNWFENVQGSFDIIVSNPPYLTKNEVDSAQDEVRMFDPINALIAEDEGFSDIEKILEASKIFLNEGGKIFMETGVLHPQIIKDKYAHMFSSIEIVKDSNKRDRFVIISK